MLSLPNYLCFFFILSLSESSSYVLVLVVVLAISCLILIVSQNFCIPFSLSVIGFRCPPTSVLVAGYLVCIYCLSLPWSFVVFSLMAVLYLEES